MATNTQFAVLGLGRFGQSIVTTLSEHGCNVLAVDEDHDAVQEMAKHATMVVQADVTDEDAMRDLGLGNFDVVIVSVGKDLEASIMATVVSKESGARYVIARAQSAKQKSILEKVGADRVVFPEWEMGARIANSLLVSNILDIINISESYGIAEIEPIKDWVGQSLAKANVRAYSGLTVIALKRNKRMIISPKPTDIMQEDDTLVVIGENADIQRFGGKTHSKKSINDDQDFK